MNTISGWLGKEMTIVTEGLEETKEGIVNVSARNSLELIMFPVATYVLIVISALALLVLFYGTAMLSSSAFSVLLLNEQSLAMAL